MSAYHALHSDGGAVGAIQATESEMSPNDGLDLHHPRLQGQVDCRLQHRADLSLDQSCRRATREELTATADLSPEGLEDDATLVISAIARSLLEHTGKTLDSCSLLTGSLVLCGEQPAPDVALEDCGSLAVRQKDSAEMDLSPERLEKNATLVISVIARPLLDHAGKTLNLCHLPASPLVLCCQQPTPEVALEHSGRLAVRQKEPTTVDLATKSLEHCAVSHELEIPHPLEIASCEGLDGDTSREGGSVSPLGVESPSRGLE
jgi:hypothetical protein